MPSRLVRTQTLELIRSSDSRERLDKKIHILEISDMRLLPRTVTSWIEWLTASQQIAGISTQGTRSMVDCNSLSVRGIASEELDIHTRTAFSNRSTEQ